MIHSIVSISHRKPHTGRQWLRYGPQENLDIVDHLGLGAKLMVAPVLHAALAATVAGNDATTKLLLHMEGADAATTFPDSSSLGVSVTASGNAQIDTAQSKFGVASSLFDGTNDYLTVADNAAWAPAIEGNPSQRRASSSTRRAELAAFLARAHLGCGTARTARRR